MAARKLQTEIDRTLKKVSEGVEQFEDQYKKIQQTTNLAHKDKLEQELKTQIKKLQRLRDQIKTWLASNEIKDKKALTDNRKLIETQMERFKACEKEMKTKAFSKEGLSAASKLDPKEQLKLDTGAWVSNQVDELSRQIESTEAEVEQLQGGLKKGKKGGANDRVADLEAQNERRKWHVSRLELVNRLMENGNMEPDRVVALKEDISYFIESNTEEDFEEDEGIYDDLNLEEQEEAFGMAQDDVQSSHDSMSIADTSDMAAIAPTLSSARTPAKATKPTPSREATAELGDSHNNGDRSPTATKTTTTTASKARKATLDGTAQRPTGLGGPSRSASGVPTVSTPTKEATPSAISTSGASPAPARSTPAVLPPIRYSAAAASAVSNSSNNPPTPSTASSVPAPSSTPAAAAALKSPTSVTSPPVGGGAVPAPASVHAKEVPAAASIAAVAAASPQLTKASISTPSAPSSTAPPSEVSPSPAPSHAQLPSSSNNLTATSNAAPEASLLSPSQQAASLAPLQALEVGEQSSQQAATSPSQPEAAVAASSSGPGAGASGTPTAGEPRLPSSLADLVTSFESAKKKSFRRDGDLSAIKTLLEGGASNIPQPSDAEKPKYYIPRNPYPTPHYYPQQPSPHLANPSLFANFDVDTLFYIFYYCQGTYLQYLAAQELKKQSWRFHKQYLTWFQRANEPQAITDEYEQGVYFYFDFEGSWAQRRKENFSFYYRHLEE